MTKLEELEAERRAAYSVYSRTMHAYLAELKKQTKENK